MATYSSSRPSPSGSYNTSHSDSDNDTPFARRSPDPKYAAAASRARGRLHLQTADTIGGYPPHTNMRSHFSHPIYEHSQPIDNALLYEISADSHSAKSPATPYRIPAISPTRSDRPRLGSVDSDAFSANSASSPPRTLRHMAMQAMSASNPASDVSALRDHSSRSAGYNGSHYLRTSSLPSASPLPIPVRSYLPRQHSISGGSPVLHLNTSRDALSSHSLPLHSSGPSTAREPLPSIQDIFGEDQLYPPPLDRSTRPRGSTSRADACPISPGLYGTSPHSLSISTASSYQLSSSQPTYSADGLSAIDNTSASLALEINERMRLTSPSSTTAPSAPKQTDFRCHFEGCKTQPFSTQYLLTSHMNVHSSSRPHYCPFPGCPRAEGGEGFKRKNEMVRHSHIHMSPRYVCPFCPDQDRKYPRPDNLQRHVRTRHGEKSMDDPILRDVLSQRPDGNKKGRRRRTGP
ncbi:hypothetical protein BROUX41_004360 [Berkeleyomyces rouxiae]|uniref:uncharacterized protein n=1 Tax=Berkeleyomyces rouxiae TaxID=2035830 RepID=UPI003B7EB4EF